MIEKKIEFGEESKYQSRVTILRSKRKQYREKKPVRVILERPSKKMSQHLKPLYIMAHADGLPIDMVLVDEGLSY